MELLFKITYLRLFFRPHQSQTRHAAAMGEANIFSHEVVHNKMTVPVCASECELWDQF